MDEIKVLLQSLVDKALSARNAKDEDDDEEEEKAENKKAKNEDVDKRDIIRQIMAIAGKEEASEDVKTIAKLAEKLAYDKSEAGTADNCKAKNEDEEEKEEDKKEDKKEAENEDGEMEYEELKEKVQKEAENKKKAKNALEEVKKVFFEGKIESTSKYMSQKDGIELGKKLY